MNLWFGRHAGPGTVKTGHNGGREPGAAQEVWGLGGDPPPTLGMVHWKMRDKKSKKATNFFKKTKLKIEFMYFGRHAYAKMMVFLLP